jgi:hypothetical protein
MNRYGLLVMGTILSCVVTAHSQQPPTSASAPAKSVSAGDPAGLPSVDTQLRVLTEKLGLSGGQRKKIRPILKQLHDATEKLAQDQSLFQEDRLAKVWPERYKADKQIRELLNDEQKKKLDAYEQGPHAEMHGNLNGATTPQ